MWPTFRFPHNLLKIKLSIPFVGISHYFIYPALLHPYEQPSLQKTKKSRQIKQACFIQSWIVILRRFWCFTFYKILFRFYDSW